MEASNALFRAARWYGLRPEERGIHAAREGRDPGRQVGEVLGNGARAVGGESDDALRSLEPLAGETHVLLAFAGDVLQGAAVDDTSVGNVGAFDGAVRD